MSNHGGKIERASYIKNEYLAYLDDLRDSRITNMFGARPYLLKEFPDLDKKEAMEVLSYWMHTFSKKGQPEEGI